MFRFPCLLCSQSPLLCVWDFQDVVRPADGVWRWDFRECLSPSHGEPLQGRWRADNPTVWVRGLQTYRQTSAVESCWGAPFSGHPCKIWQWWSLSMSSKFILDVLDIRMVSWWFHLFPPDDFWVPSCKQDCRGSAKIIMLICDFFLYHQSLLIYGLLI